MSKTPIQLRQLTQLPARNLIINGNMDFWQRGISFGTGSYAADRFQSSVTGGSSGTATQSTDVPSLAQSGFQSTYSLKYTVTNGAAIAAGQYAILSYKVEGYDYATIHSKTARLQFWTKSSLVGTYGVSLRNAAEDRSYVSSITINAANTWEKKTIDVTLDNAGTWLFNNGAGLQLTIGLSVGSTFQTSTLNSWQTGNYFGVSSQNDLVATTNNNFYIAQVQLISGDFAGNSLDLPFKRAGDTIQQELAMCQRYCIKLGGSVAGIATGRLDTSNSAYFGIVWPTTMRGTPSVISSTGVNGWTISTAAGANGINGTITAATIDANGGYMNNVTTGGGGTPGTAVVITGQGAESLLLLSAEL